MTKKMTGLEMIIMALFERKPGVLDYPEPFRINIERVFNDSTSSQSTVRH